MCWVQTSFRDVRCINSGAMPFPKHGRQMKVNEAAITDEQVLTRMLTVHASISQHVQHLHKNQSTRWQDTANTLMVHE